MQNRCWAIGCFLNNSSKTHAHFLAILMILRNFISLRVFFVYMKTHCGLKFHFGQFEWIEICTKVSFTPPEVMWMLIMKLPHTEVKFYPEVKYQTGLSSIWVSCKRAQKEIRKIMCEICSKLTVLVEWRQIKLFWCIYCLFEFIYTLIYFFYCWLYMENISVTSDLSAKIFLRIFTWKMHPKIKL